jgi:hypothetical protein
VRVIYDGRIATLFDDWKIWDKEKLLYAQKNPTENKLYVRIRFIPSGVIQQVPVVLVEIYEPPQKTIHPLTP